MWTDFACWPNRAVKCKVSTADIFRTAYQKSGAIHNDDVIEKYQRGFSPPSLSNNGTIRCVRQTHDMGQGTDTLIKQSFSRTQTPHRSFLCPVSSSFPSQLCHRLFLVSLHKCTSWIASCCCCLQTASFVFAVRKYLGSSQVYKGDRVFFLLFFFSACQNELLINKQGKHHLPLGHILRKRHSSAENFPFHV